MKPIKIPQKEPAVLSELLLQSDPAAVVLEMLL